MSASYDDGRGPFDGGDATIEAYRASIWRQMLTGAFFASLVLIGPGIFIYVLYLIGTLLPPESKEADDPTPDSFSHYELVIEDNRQA
ncbi:RC-LH1 core complex protein PufX [Roseobacteraceae bacterium S113]